MSVWGGGIEFRVYCCSPFVWFSLLHVKCICAESHLSLLLKDDADGY